MERIDQYFSYRLSPVLSRYIDCVWGENYFDQPANKGRAHLIVPDNSVELVISEHRIQRELITQGLTQHFTSHLAGLKTQPQKIRLDRSTLLSIRFRPHGLYRFTGINARELVDQNVSPEQIFGRDFTWLEEQLLETSNWEKRLDLIECFFRQRLTRNASQNDPLFEAFLQHLERGKGHIPIAGLADYFKVSVKTLERKCLQYLGITPKKYSRLVRLFNALSISTCTAESSLTDIAYRNGYYDQMHFIKEVKHFTGMVPGHFFQKDRGIQRAIFTEKNNSFTGSF
jgi:AraC-like DNA-binding protein